MQEHTSSEPLISVIMPTYNHSGYIGAAIRSLLAQTYPRFELIVIDNYSQDGTADIVRSFRDERIQYFQFRNEGVIAASRNLGIQQSHGKFIAFFDSDDVWHVRKLEMQLPHFQSSEIIGVASDLVPVAETLFYRQQKFGKSKAGYIDYRYQDILNASRFVTSSLVVRRQALECAGYFDENKDFCCIEDWELWLRMARLGTFRVLADPLVYYRVARREGHGAVTIAQNCLKVLDKQVRLGYVRENEIIESRAWVYLKIARTLLELDQRQSRQYYRKGLGTTSRLRCKIKCITGILLTFCHADLRKAILLILYRSDWFLLGFTDLLGSMRNLGRQRQV